MISAGKIGLNKIKTTREPTDDYTQLRKLATASLPSAAAANEGGIVYDSSTDTVKFSNGSSWANIDTSAASSTADGIYNNGAWTVAVDANDVIWNLATGFNMVIAGAAAGTTAEALVIDDGGGTLTAAIKITGSNEVTTAIDVSDAQIGVALAPGANNIAATNWSIAGATGAATFVGVDYGTGKLVGTGNIEINTNLFVVTGASGNLNIGPNNFTVAAATGNTVIAGSLTVQSIVGENGADLGIAASATTNQALTLNAGGSGTVGLATTSTGAVTIGNASINAIGLTTSGVGTGTVTITGDLSVTGGITWGSVVVMSAGGQMNSSLLAFDADDDSGLQSSANNDIDVVLGGAQEFSFETARLDMNGNHLDECGYIRFSGDSTAPAAGTCDITRDNTGDLTINCMNTKTINLAVNAVDVARFGATTLAFQQASTISTAATTLTLDPATDVGVANGKGLVIGGTAQVTAGQAYELQVTGTGAADSGAIVHLASADAVGPTVAFVKSRNAAIGGFTIVADNDALGVINFHASDAADYATVCARIQGEVDDAAPAASDIGGALVFSTSSGAGADDIAEKLRINAAGNTCVANGFGVVIGSETQSTVYATGAAATLIPELQVEGTGAEDSAILVGRFSADAVGATVNILKSRHGTIGSSTVLNDNDVIGSIAWFGADGGDLQTPAGTIHVEIDGTAAANDMPGAMVFSTTPDGTNAVTEKLRISPSGQILGNSHDGVAHAAATNGLVLDQQANDNYIFVLKSSTDVATGLTSAVASANDVETDDYLAIDKFAATTGGVRIAGLGENAAVTSNVVIESYGGQADNTKSTAGRSLVEVYASQHDGANALANVASNGNVFGVRGRRGGADVALAMVDEDGDLWVGNAVDAATAYCTASPTFRIAANYVQAAGAANAITVTLNDLAGTAVPLTDGLMLLVDLNTRTLQAGANTLNLNAGGAVSIVSCRNVANNIGTAYAANGFITLVYNATSTVWMDMSQ